jgi:hypothetical protein
VHTRRTESSSPVISRAIWLPLLALLAIAILGCGSAGCGRASSPRRLSGDVVTFPCRGDKLVDHHQAARE